MLTLPSPLATPLIISGHVAAKVMLDLTIYLTGPSEAELEYLIDLYEYVCPFDRMVKYRITEVEFWQLLDPLVLTASGRAAEAAGIRRPYIEPVRKRIRDGRAFDLQFWDGNSIDDFNESWSFSCRRIHKRSTGLHTFLRFLIPLKADYNILQKIAFAIADKVGIYSGHGGLVFVYDPWYKESALDNIYAQARRFWGVDVEDMNRTLPLMKNHIKGVNWITMIGQSFIARPEIRSTLDHLMHTQNVAVEQMANATVLVAGPTPIVGDQHRVDHSLDPYYSVAEALKPLFLDMHPDFSSERFVKNSNTLGWIRRFIDPNGWR